MSKLSFLRDNGKPLELLAREELLERLVRPLPEPLRSALQEAMHAALQERQAALEALLEEKQQELLEQIPENYRYLLLRMAEFKDRTVPLLDYAREAGAAQQLMLGVASQARIDLDVLTPAEFERHEALGLGEDDLLLKLAFRGTLGVSVSATPATPVLKAGVAVTANTEQQLAYYLMLDKRSRAISTLPVVKDCLAGPLDLDALVQAMQSSRLARFERSGLRSASLGLTLGLGKDILAGLRDDLKASVGLDLRVDYRDQAELSLVLEQLADGSFALELKKHRSTSNASTLKLGVDFEITGFRQRLLEHLTKLMPEEDGVSKVLDRLDGYIEQVGREQLAGKLQERLAAAWPQGQPVFAWLLGQEESAALAGRIQTELVERIQEALSTRVDLYNDEAAAVASRVAEELAGKLGIGPELRPRFDSYLRSALQGALEAAQARLEDGLQELVDSDDIAELLRPWSFIGEEVARALGAIAGGAANRLQQVKTALQTIYARYTGFRLRVLQTVKDDFEEKLALSCISAKERDIDTTHALRVGFSSVNDDLRALYRALWNSRIDDLGALLGKLRQAGLTVDGEYVTAEAFTREFTLTAALFGRKLKAEQLFSSDVKVAIDTSGRLLVAKSEAALKQSRGWRGERQNIEARWSVDYLRHEVLEAPLIITLAVSDEKFKPRRDVAQFFTCLERFRVMRSGVGDSVQRTLFPAHDSKAIPHAEIAIQLVLRWQDWLRMVGRDLQEGAVPDAWEAGRIGRDFLLQVQQYAPDYHAHAQTLMGYRKYQDLYTYLLDFGSKGADAHRWSLDPMAEGKGARGERYTKGRRLALAVHGLHHGIDALQAAWTALVAALPDADVALTEAQADALRGAMSEVNFRFYRLFSAVTSTGLLLDDAGRINWLTAAALGLFKDNAGMPNQWLSCTFKSERTGELVFS